MPEVGVVLAVYNGAAFLSEALRSIAAQTLRPLDVLAVDDGSTDDSVRLLHDFGVRTLHTENVGQAVARDRGITSVRGDFIAFLDQDDRWLPDKLARQVARLSAEPDLDFVGALSRVFLDAGADRPSWWKSSWDNDIPEPSLLPSATLYRRSAFERVGGFATDAVRVSEDLAWTALAQDLGLHRAIVDEVLVQRRIHARNTSGDPDVRVREHLNILRASLKRKRAACD